MHKVAKKLERGQALYGNRALTYSVERLIDEIDEEVVDIAAWGFFAWLKLRSLAASIPTNGRRPRRGRCAARYADSGSVSARKKTAGKSRR
jgi:hypothetical protein